MAGPAGVSASCEGGRCPKVTADGGGNLQLENLVLKPCVLPDDLPFTLEAAVVGRVAVER